jgi:hypothetical protein
MNPDLHDILRLGVGDDAAQFYEASIQLIDAATEWRAAMAEDEPSDERIDAAERDLLVCIAQAEACRSALLRARQEYWEKITETVP